MPSLAFYSLARVKGQSSSTFQFSRCCEAGISSLHGNISLKECIYQKGTNKKLGDFPQLVTESFDKIQGFHLNFPPPLFNLTLLYRKEGMISLFFQESMWLPCFFFDPIGIIMSKMVQCSSPDILVQKQIKTMLKIQNELKNHFRKVDLGEKSQGTSTVLLTFIYILSFCITNGKSLSEKYKMTPLSQV